jgi:hypothetical protein
VNNFLVFFLSGMMHVAVLWRLGIRCTWKAEMEHWVVQPVALVLEGLVEQQWRQFRKKKLTWAREGILDSFELAVGYAWVVAWFMWEAPRREAAIERCHQRTGLAWLSDN